MPLSKDWQLQDALGFLKNLTSQIAIDKISTEQIIDALHLGIAEVAQLLSELKFYDYATVATLSISSDEASISSLNVMSIIKIVDATNGLCVYEKPHVFEGLKSLAIPQNLNNVSWTRHGEMIQLYKGSLGFYGVVKIHYNRYPTKATSDATYLDIKDPFMKVVLDKAKLHIYEQLGMKAPAQLEQTINNSIIQMRKAYGEELTQRRSQKNQIPSGRR